jgi:type II secretion system protein H
MGEVHSRGVTLTEILVVLAILGMAAVVAIPNLYSGDPHALDLAAQQFAEAMRYARSEALRTGEPRGVRIQASQKRIQVFRPDTPTLPAAPVYDIHHPVSRQLYDIELDGHPLASADSVSRSATFRGTCNTPTYIYFDANGTPWCWDPVTVVLQQQDITLTLGAASRVVTLHGITGRVTIQ